MTPEQKEERRRWRTEREAFEKRVKDGTITPQEAAAEKKRLDEWYTRWETAVIGRDGLSNGSV